MSKNRPESVPLQFNVLRLADEFPGLLPFRRGERGRQHFIKLTREDEESYLFVGSNGSLRSEIQQALMRLVNEGWSAEGEVSLEFDGQGEGANDAPFITDPIVIEVGRALLPLVDPQNGAPLLDHIETLRSELAQLLGLFLPQIRVHDNLGIEEQRFVVRIKGAPVYASDLFLDRLFVIGSPQQLDGLEGWTTHDPILGSRAKWIEGEQKEKAESLSCTILGPLALMMHHLRTVLAQASSDLLGLQDVYELVDRLSSTHPVVAEPFLENRTALRYLQRVLRELLAEGIPIKDLVTVAEVAGQAYDNKTLPGTAVEECRRALHFLLCSRLLDEEGQLIALALGPDWEEVLQELSRDPHLNPDSLKSRGEPLVTGIKKKLEEVSPQRVAALVTDPGTRRVVRKILEASIPRLAVLATDELAPSLKILVAGSVTRGSNKPSPDVGP